MLYSGRHSMALTRMYFETFGEPVPEQMVKRSARDGQIQELMGAVDDAIRNRMPLREFDTDFPEPPASDSRRTD